MAASVQTSWTTARLTEASTHGYLVVALSTGPWPLPPALPRSSRRALLAQLSDLAARLGAEPDVVEAAVFRGFIRPPGERSLSGQWRGPVRYDAVLLVRTSSPEAARRLQEDDRIRGLSEGLPAALTVAGRNLRRIADVDHRRQGVFLFNYFTSDDPEQCLFAWQYTAGWFQEETGLDNSTVLGDLGDGSPFGLINHCRWDRVRDILPSLIFKPSFRRFVLGTFRENRVAPHPALYRLHFTTTATTP